MLHQEYAVAVELIEQQALDDFFRAASDTDRSTLGLEQIELAGGVLYLARNEPNILLNRVVGIGHDRPVIVHDIAAIRDTYAAAGVSDYFLHIQPWVRPPHVWNWLFDAGLARDRGWTQFVRGAEPTPVKATALRVEQIGSVHAVDFAGIVTQGFDLSRAAIPVLAAMVGLPGWYHFMTFQGDQPVGTAALRVDKGLGWLDWSATTPEFRGQGSQTALLNRRIQKAVELGCHTLCSETGEAVPGDPQHSFHNLVRAGFRPTHTRDNFSPCAVPDASGRIPFVTA